MRYVFLMIAMALSVAAQQSATTTADAERYIRDSESQWAEAVANGDVSVVQRILADDYIGVDAGDGHLYHKAEAISWIQGHHAEYLFNHLDEVNVRFFGNTAVAQGSESWERRTGEPRRGRFAWTDTWVLRNGQWQIVAAEDLIAPPLSTKAASKTVSQESARDRVIGTWQLVSAGTFRRDGSFEPYPEYGPNAKGYLMYDSTGHMCVSLANPNHPHWVNPEKPTDTEKIRSYDVFFAYCGTYEIREKEGRIIHRPEMGSWPHYIGTDQNRNFRLEEDRLILSDEETPPNGEHRRYQITWQRVSLPSYAAQKK